MLKTNLTTEQKLSLWREFDKKIEQKFMDNFHLGESSITIADYMQLKLDMGMIAIRVIEEN
jgi:hypothetical protein